MGAQFPNTIWDGSSRSRPAFNADRSPDFFDWDQLVEELQATQKETIVTALNPLTLANSWKNKLGYIASYQVTGSSKVQLTGVITPGTLTDATVIFTLPESARPTRVLTFSVCPSGSDAGDSNMRVSIDPDGDVSVYGLTNTESIDLSSVSFNTGW